MLNVLFCGHYLEKTGWGFASRGYLKALNRTGHNIIARPVKPNPNNPEAELDEELRELSGKPLKNIDISIQHVLPHYFNYDGRLKKNIGILITESKNWFHSGWYRYANMMDEIWFPNFESFCSAKQNRVTVPCDVVPHAFDINLFNKDWEPLKVPHTDGNFKFYFIGEHSRRKRISAALQAFHLAFKPNEPVSFIIKANKPNISVIECRKDLEKLCSEVKHALKLYPQIHQYLHELLITDYLDFSQIMGLHETGNCFISGTMGEAWLIDAFLAMGMGNQVITSNCDGPADYLAHYEHGYLIKGHYQPATGMLDTFPNLCTGYDELFNIDINRMARAMRLAYDKGPIKTREAGWKQAEKYSYESVGKIMKELLNV
jgi:glycosyltransferase involved in cell wall biosynthesis